jgi:hypothetical protein
MSRQAKLQLLASTGHSLALSSRLSSPSSFPLASQIDDDIQLGLDNRWTIWLCTFCSAAQLEALGRLASQRLERLNLDSNNA